MLSSGTLVLVCLRCLRVDCTEHQCPMMTDRDIAKMLTRVPWEGMGGEDTLMMHNNCAKSKKLGKCIVSSNRKLSSEKNARINSIRCSI